MKTKYLLIALILILMIPLTTVTNAGVADTDLTISNSFSGISVQSIKVPIYITDTTGTMDKTLGYSATLEYDDTIFETVTFEGKNNWSATIDTATKKITQDTTSAEQNQETGILTFKVKTYTKNTTTQIKIKSILISDGNTQKSPIDKTINVVLNVDETTSNTTTNTTNITNTANVTNTNTSNLTTNVSNANSNTNTNSLKTNDNTTSIFGLPSAGVKSFLITAIVITLIAIAFFKFKSRKIKH